MIIILNDKVIFKMIVLIGVKESFILKGIFVIELE